MKILKDAFKYHKGVQFTRRVADLKPNLAPAQAESMGAGLAMTFKDSGQVQSVKLQQPLTHRFEVKVDTRKKGRGIISQYFNHR